MVTIDKFLMYSTFIALENAYKHFLLTYIVKPYFKGFVIHSGVIIISLYKCQPCMHTHAMLPWMYIVALGQLGRLEFSATITKTYSLHAYMYVHAWNTQINRTVKHT